MTNAYYTHGVAYAGKRQWDKAIADYDKALQIDPNYTNARANRDTIAPNLTNSRVGNK
jgi:tetratricopeptide (TPR) repeat protein